jgi:hypothetical protein
VVAFNQAVFALSPAALGVLRDISTNYVVPSAFAAAMQIVAALIVLIRPSGSRLVKVEPFSTRSIKGGASRNSSQLSGVRQTRRQSEFG